MSNICVISKINKKNKIIKKENIIKNNKYNLILFRYKILFDLTKRI